MAQSITLTAEHRTGSGSSGARRLRAEGRVPAVIYGHGRETESVSLSQKDLEKALHGIAAGSTVFDITVDGKTVKALIRELQRHPIRPGFVHVDFYEIRAGEAITLEVPVHLVGTPDGVRNAGGVLDQVLRGIEIEVLPQNIPERVELDVTNLAIGKSLHVRDIRIENATILNHPDDTVCTVVPPRVEEEAPAAAVVEEPAEPELIRKPRTEEEEAAEGEQPEKE